MRKRTIALALCGVLALGSCAAKQYFAKEQQDVLAHYGVPALAHSIALHMPKEPPAVASLPHARMGRVDDHLEPLRAALWHANRAARHSAPFEQAVKYEDYAQRTQHAGMVGALGLSALLGYSILRRR